MSRLTTECDAIPITISQEDLTQEALLKDVIENISRLEEEQVCAGMFPVYSWAQLSSQNTEVQKLAEKSEAYQKKYKKLKSERSELEKVRAATVVNSTIELNTYHYARACLRYGSNSIRQTQMLKQRTRKLPRLSAKWWVRASILPQRTLSIISGRTSRQ